MLLKFKDLLQHLSLLLTIIEIEDVVTTLLLSITVNVTSLVPTDIGIIVPLHTLAGFSPYDVRFNIVGCETDTTH